MIQKFRKKPVEIEAVQWNGANHLITETFMKGSGAYLDQEASPLGVIKIPTLEGVMEARVGDWIIKGVKGEFYPCKDQIFKLTYDAVIPPEVVEAQKYMREMSKDIGFMGSPKYREAQQIVEAYYAPIRQKERDEADREEYARLKEKFNE